MASHRGAGRRSARRSDPARSYRHSGRPGWTHVLRTVAGSRLVLKDRTLIDSGQRARILTVLAAHGVATDRVTQLGWPESTEPYETYHDIDLALDPFPHSGGMTTLEALWMG